MKTHYLHTTIARSRRSVFTGVAGRVGHVTMARPPRAPYLQGFPPGPDLTSAHAGLARADRDAPSHGGTQQPVLGARNVSPSATVLGARRTTFSHSLPGTQAEAPAGSGQVAHRQGSLPDLPPAGERRGAEPDPSGNSDKPASPPREAVVSGQKPRSSVGQPEEPAAPYEQTSKKVEDSPFAVATTTWETRVPRAARKAVRRLDIESPEFRVKWEEGEPRFPGHSRVQVERQIVHAAKGELRKRAAAGKVTVPLPPNIDVRVEHVTVKIEQPQSAHPRSPEPTRQSTGGGGEFSSYSLKRMISGF